MDHHIDKISEKFINKYIGDGRLVDINGDYRHHLQKYARKHQYFEQKGDIVNYSWIVCQLEVGTLLGCRHN